MPGPRKKSLWNGTYSAGSIGELQGKKHGGFSRTLACRLTPHQFITGEAVRVCTLCGFTEPLVPLSPGEQRRKETRSPAQVVARYLCKLCGQWKDEGEMVLVRREEPRHQRGGFCQACVHEVKREAERGTT